MLRILLGFIWLAMAGTASAITIFTAKEIVTLDAQHSSVSAVAVEGDEILATGTLEALLQQFPSAEVDHQFAEQVIVPGFINQHDHPFLAAITMATQVISIEEWTLPERTYPAAYSPSEYHTKLKQYLHAHQQHDFFISWGYHRLWHGELDRAQLDNLSPDVPVLIWQRSGHEIIFNTLALQQLGLDQKALAEFPEHIRKQIDLPRGHFWEQGLLAILPKIIPVLASPERYAPALEVIRDYWLNAGVTRVIEPGGLTLPHLMDIQLKVLGQADTPFRMDYIIDAKLVAQRFGMDGMLASVDEMVASWGSAHSRYYPKQVKMFSDGAIFSQLMQMRDGYLDGHEGEWMTPQDKFKILFEKFWQAGYQIHIHQNGDAGLDFVLDVLADNLQRHPREDHRTTIVHFGFSSPDQVERIAELGVIVSANPYYPVALGEKYSDHGIGPERAQEMVRLADLAERGLSFSLHSDMPMAPGQPLFLMWCAVNRLDPQGNVIGPQQRISALQALKAVTIDAAYSIQQEDRIGSIEAGKLANLTVLAENPLNVDPLLIKDIDVIATVHEGTVHANL